MATRREQRELGKAGSLAIRIDKPHKTAREKARAQRGGSACKLNDKLVDELCGWFASGVTIGSACNAVGIGHDTFNSWKRKAAAGVPKFAAAFEKIDKARARQAAGLAMTILGHARTKYERNADGVVADGGMQEGKPTPEALESTKWAIKNMFAKSFDTPVKSGGVEVQVDSDAENKANRVHIVVLPPEKEEDDGFA